MGGMERLRRACAITPEEDELFWKVWRKRAFWDLDLAAELCDGPDQLAALSSIDEVAVGQVLEEYRKARCSARAVEEELCDMRAAVLAVTGVDL